MTESAIQIAIVRYLRLQYPGAIIHHSRNEGNRGGSKGVRDGARGKQMGLMAGFPDLLVGLCDIEGWPLPPIGIEVKTAKGRQSDAQKDAQRMFESLGWIYRFCRSVDDVAALMDELGA